jgi:protein-S-isoprenylcysteine O-methyltransferase Ste14
MTYLVETVGASSESKPPLVRWLDRLGRTWTYDVSIRILFLATYSYVEYMAATGLVRYFARMDSIPPALFVTSVLARSAVILFVAIAMALVIIRSRPTRKAKGLLPRLTAFVGTILPMAFPFFPAEDGSLVIAVLSATLIFAGNGLSIYVIGWLGRSYSTMAEARQLKTSGPYAAIRHPLYAAEEVAVFGIYLFYASPWTTVLLLSHILLQIQRMRNEEAILRQAFPAYDEYSRRTARIIPGVY